ncbi:NYN domain-containing protein [Ramlibacter sp. MMS24-I3-19]|uniref:NYN domain-containing protein n=1 Tax=Ramlibacter sp. MMS24-I3-19 TaxID=3416606 RepID=UPI003CFC02DA
MLIDADNPSFRFCEDVLEEVARYGRATIRRAYGDWTTDNLKGWKEMLHKHAIQPVQQFRYTTGKNATDSAMIIDAMDLLHGERLDGFCLVSSDSDFTRLATRIREAGLTVYGFGEEKTPKAFIAACDKFIYVEVLRNEPEKVRDVAVPDFQPLVFAALDATAREDGWAHLGAIGAQLTRNQPSFDPRNYGVKKLGELMRKQPYLEVKDVPAAEGSAHLQAYVRRKSPAGARSL